MRKLTALFFASVLMLAAGCSDDDSPKSAKKTTTTAGQSTTTTTETPALAPNQIDTKASPYCATWADIRGAGGPKSQEPADVREHYGALLPIVEKLLSEAPSSIESAVGIALDSTKKVVASGSLDDFQRPEVLGAQKRLTEYAAEHCAKKR